jgi:hypothetical protein
MTKKLRLAKEPLLRLGGPPPEGPRESATASVDGFRLCCLTGGFCSVGAACLEDDPDW